MSDGLSSSKRRYIENWRQSVSVHMESGNICRVTISEMTPEPTVKSSTEHVKAVSDIANILDDGGSPTLPTVKFSYHHGMHPDTKNRHSRLSDRFSTDRKRDNRVILPPSPNGCVIQNGLDQSVSRSSSSVLKSLENNPHKEHLVAREPRQRKSSITAREMYEKYNMKSKTNNYLMPKSKGASYEQYSMPWRNKTFLSLPLRFTGNIHRSHSMMSRQKTFASDFSRDDVSDVDEENDW